MSMSAQERVLQAFVRTAAEEGGPPPAPFRAGGGSIGAPTKRKIPANHPFDPKAIKPLVKMLWATSVALGHALTAHRQFSRLKSVGFSPDGLVGGRGYVMSVKDVRQRLYEASEALSTICDTIHDEVNAPHWKPKLADLEKQDLSEVERLMGDAEEYIEDPEGEAEEDMADAEKNGKKWIPDGSKHEEHSTGSKMPGGGNAQQEGPGPNPASAHRPALNKQASSRLHERIVRRFLANSSVSPDSLSGPRVQHLGPAEGQGPFGSANRDESIPVGDEWGRDQGVGSDYAYPSDWDANVSDRTSGSSLPDSNTDTTPTDGFDFGIGRGNGNDAHGQGAGGYGTSNPSSGGKGVYGPRAELPDDPGGKTHDNTSDSNPVIEQGTSGRSIPSTASTVLPNDQEPPVARSDYYQGPKGNDFDGIVGESQVPGDGGPSGFKSLKDPGPNIGYRYERPDVPYTKFDYNTPQMRPDWQNQRDPLQGPYTK
jgi:hypothetical protein